MQTHRLRVAHIVTGLRAGGAERLLVDHAAHTRHQVEVIALAHEGVMADRLRALGVPVHCVWMTHNRDLRAVQRLTRILRQTRPDVVHVHLYRALLFGRLSARLAGIKAIVATEHSAAPEATERRPATRRVKAMYRIAERWGRLTIAVSAETRDVLIRHWGLDAARVTVIPNGVDVQAMTPTPSARAACRARLGIPEQHRVLVTTGRLSQGKHVDRLIDAVARLTVGEGRRDVDLLVVGDGDLRTQLIQHAAELGVCDQVRFIGEVADVLPYLACADVYVSASEYETYGISIVEAYVSGLPVVYHNSPAAADLARVADGGRLQRSSPEPAALAEAILAALQLPVGPQHVEAAVRRLVDVAAVCQRIDDAEESVLAGP